MKRSIAGMEFLATAQVSCVLLPENMLYAKNNRFYITIPPYWLINFDSTVYMYLCRLKMAL